MQAYHWPGNIRQLENVIRSYVLLGNEESLVSELMPETANSELMPQIDLDVPISLKLVIKRATQQLERQIIFRVLKANMWNRQKTAKWLKISYRSLLYKLNDQGLTEPPPVPTGTQPMGAPSCNSKARSSFGLSPPISRAGLDRNNLLRLHS